MHVHTYTCKIRKEEIMNLRENMESIGGAKSERLMYKILSNNNKKEPCKKGREKCELWSDPKPTIQREYARKY